MTVATDLERARSILRGALAILAVAASTKSTARCGISRQRCCRRCRKVGETLVDD